MGKHTITLEDAIKALDQEISIAASASAKKKASKSLHFNPTYLKYRVRYRKTDSGMETSNSYIDPLIAIEKYNEYDV